MASTSSGIEFTQNGKDYDIKLFQGKSIEFSITWGGGSPIDVTGFTSKMHVKKRHDSETPEAEFTVAIGSTDGLITYTIAKATSAALTPGNYVFDIAITDAAGKRMLAQSGKCVIEAEVTEDG